MKRTCSSVSEFLSQRKQNGAGIRDGVNEAKHRSYACTAEQSDSSIHHNGRTQAIPENRGIQKMEIHFFFYSK